MRAELGGGGGWGDPLERDPAAVLEDVLDEYVSVAGARRDYGVVIVEGEMTVDEAATRALRESMAGGGAVGRVDTSGGK
jgi:N-methylhydantoinase B